jgi:hypothetical protein
MKPLDFGEIPLSGSASNNDFRKLAIFGIFENQEGNVVETSYL